MNHHIKDPEITFVKGVLYMCLNKQIIDDHLKCYPDTSTIQGRDNRTKRDGDDYHITLIEPSEMKRLKTDPCGSLTEKQILDTIEASNIKRSLDLRMVGLGRASNGSASCTYIVVLSNALQKLRKDFNLSSKDLHVTIGFIESDVHGICKDMKTIYSVNVDNIKQQLDEIIKKDLYDQDYLEKKIDMKKDQISVFHENNRYLLWIFNNDVLLPRIEKILIDVCYRFIDKLKVNTNLHKKVSSILEDAGYLIGVYFMSKYSQTPANLAEIYDVFVERVIKNNLMIRDGLDQDTIENTLKVLNFPVVQNVKWLYDFNCTRTRVYRYYEYQYDKKIFTFVESPRNFSFVTNNLAGSSIPDKQEHIDLFNKVKIDSIITLMEVPLDPSIQKIIKEYGMRYKHFYVDDREPMSTEQMNDIVKIIDSNKRTLVHCRGGVGRTATALVGYLITLGHDRELSVRALDKRKTILSSTQDSFLKEWKNIQMMKQSTQEYIVDPASSNEKTSDDGKKQQRKVAKIKLPTVMMMVGLPASGKSTFTKIIHDQIVNIERISQDEIRTKGACEDLFSKFTKSRETTVLLDRCNPNKEERKYWLSLNTGSDKNVWCIFFDSNVEECRWRIKNRTDHPTVKPHQGERIVENVAGILEEPTLDEGFSHIERICSFKDANQLLLKIGCDISGLVEANHDQIIKFPRTKHMYNLGGASRDDLILSQEDIKSFLNTILYIEEKIDGANMGLSLKNFKIIAQNRSHYVNSGYHPQFKLLDKWIMDHSKVLFEILEDDTKILYGEWVYAKHSINYTALTDYFIAYDLYDIVEQRFYSRPRLEKLLEGTNIKLIPCVKTGIFKNVEQIVELVRSKSMFYDGPIEGVYIRRCTENWLEDRAKIVRNDFICGDKHWAKNILTVNSLQLIPE